MTCREFADFIGDYESGALPEPARASFERHLTRCLNCQRYLTHYREAVALGRAAFEDEDAAVPGNVPEDLIAAILAARNQKPG
jgi:anti-sigma factor RsiW